MPTTTTKKCQMCKSNFVPYQKFYKICYACWCKKNATVFGGCMIK